MLDVTSSEKLMWPLRETRSIRSLFRAIYLNLQVRIKTSGRLVVPGVSMMLKR